MIIPVSVDLNRTVVDSALLTSRQPVQLAVIFRVEVICIKSVDGEFFYW